MSFLNALASDGLSVGLRFYTAKLNGRAAGAGSGCEAAEEIQQKNQQAAETAPEAAKAAGAGKAATKPALTPEELAAGRAEAQAKLTEDGSLGRLKAAGPPALSQGGPAEAGQPEAGLSEAATAQGKGGAANLAEEDLTEEERQAVQEMKQRDQEVRTHEQAHVAAAAGLAGAPVYEYQTGPDGRRYAVGGHVEVQTSGSSDPETALREAEAVKRAATAPANPSGADRAAAASASAEINKLKAEAASDRSAGQDGQPAEDQDGSQGDGAAEAQNKGFLSGLAETAAKAVNGSPFGRQVLGAYAAAKFAGAAQAVRPVLARA